MEIFNDFYFAKQKKKTIAKISNTKIKNIFAIQIKKIKNKAGIII